MKLAKIRRLVLFYFMVLSGVIIAFTGILLYLWPHGPKSGQLVILGFQKSFWQDVHTYAAIFGVAAILLHLIENRRCVKLYVRETLRGV
ncbi:MAG: hypothetical protein XD40_1363 [Archaeoglobus fulgidus]|uniref:Flavinylation-associated cytochrome domain-containing protein n=1 Tax=Archaeoglobus fulgidus TaxID=2234 RepID=A0A117KM03_ARCFL|nr:DUF4405 domain-containing protein [Archaeoglobus fulgidus]KUJ93448.1 MAG: hypothetical protein XD40_1363 [Archaeoglobus fulgidus]KUK07075.1 MAG: Uncharacterized protein XD48_0699 [Archaeoglobus fulgidus]